MNVPEELRALYGRQYQPHPLEAFLHSDKGTIVIYSLLIGVFLYILLTQQTTGLSQIVRLLIDSLSTIMPPSLARVLGSSGTLLGGYTGTSDSKPGVMKNVFDLAKGAQSDRTLRTLTNLFHTKRSDAPAGLGNWDNSCYQNSVLQGLASLSSLRDFLTEFSEKSGLDFENSTIGALSGLMAKLTSPENNGQKLWTPAKLKSMSSWQQQDAQEYFSKIMEQLDKDARSTLTEASPNIKTGKALGLAAEVEKDTQKVESERNQQAEAAKVPQKNPLEGLLGQRVACMQCGYSEGISLIPFNCLTVPLGRGNIDDIRDCLDEYTKLEFIEGVQCEKCTLLKIQAQMQRLLETSESEPLRKTLTARLETINGVLEDEDFAENTLTKKCHIPKKNWVSTTKSRQAVVARAPKSLMIHVNRSVFDEFTGAQRKNYARVLFEAHMDLKPWCLGADVSVNTGKGTKIETWPMDPGSSLLGASENEVPSGGPQYNLKAVVTHYGRHENGHYVCSRRHPKVAEGDRDAETVDDVDEEQPAKEQWWELSDEDVRPISEEDVVRQGEVFMLFYEQSETQCPPVMSPHASHISVTSEATSTATGHANGATNPSDTTEEEAEPNTDRNTATSTESQESDPLVGHATRPMVSVDNSVAKLTAPPRRVSTSALDTKADATAPDAALPVSEELSSVNKAATPPPTDSPRTPTPVLNTGRKNSRHRDRGFGQQSMRMVAAT